MIWKEIEILKPKRVVFYTGRGYDDFIEKFKPINCNEFIDIVNDFDSCWWHRRFLDSNKNVICELLRVFHPQRKAKEEYVAKLVEWLNQTS